MRTIIIATSIALAACSGAVSARAQGQTQTGATAGARVSTGDAPQSAATGDARPAEQRVPVNAEAIALDIGGRSALAGRLRTTQLSGTPDAPGRNSRLILENRSALFYNYVSGWATFYDAEGVRCGEGLWKVEALAPNESAEVDTPGLRLTCAPTSWRIVATNLITRTGDAAKPPDNTPPQSESALPTSTAMTTTTTTTNAPLPPLEININGKTLPIQPGNPLEITVGKERVRIILNPAP